MKKQGAKLTCEKCGRRIFDRGPTQLSFCTYCDKGTVNTLLCGHLSRHRAYFKSIHGPVMWCLNCGAVHNLPETGTRRKSLDGWTYPIAAVYPSLPFVHVKPRPNEGLTLEEKLDRVSIAAEIVAILRKYEALLDAIAYKCADYDSTYSQADSMLDHTDSADHRTLSFHEGQCKAGSEINKLIEASGYSVKERPEEP